jgi:hypothetical protein
MSQNYYSLADEGWRCRLMRNADEVLAVLGLTFTGTTSSQYCRRETENHRDPAGFF